MMMMELLEANRDADRPANIAVYKQVMCSASSVPLKLVSTILPTVKS